MEYILTVSIFNNYCKNILENEQMLQNILISGEVSSSKASGMHLYFNLKDENASLPCVAFFYQKNGIALKDGEQVVLKGSADFYAKTGKLNFVANKLISKGMGVLALKYAKLKEQLEREGFFEEKNKKQLPKYPTKIGVITSQTGAVIRDILAVRERKNTSVEILIYHSKVQGINADMEIVKAIEVLNRTDVEVIIIARGGGSLDDIETFFSEKIVRAVFASKIPIVSAVGHETDFTFCDFVADKRASTPTLAAEICIFDKKEYALILGELNSRIYMQLRNKIRLANLTYKSQFAKIDIEKVFEKCQNGLYNKVDILYNQLNSKLLLYDKMLSLSMQNIQNSNVVNVLKRGFALVEKANKNISSKSELCEGDQVEINFIDGKVKAEII